MTTALTAELVPIPVYAMATCEVCGTGMRRPRFGASVCGARACRVAHLGGNLRAARKRQRLTVAEACRSAADAINYERGLAGHASALPFAVLPSNDRVVGPLPRAMGERFMAMLAAKVGRVMSRRADNSAQSVIRHGEPTELPTPDASLDTSMDAMFAGACATCRGDCCTGGTDHAHMDEDSLERLQQLHGWTTPDAVLAAYAAHLPRVHYKGSCIYHGTGGCALPRDMRADVCNRYLCGSLAQLSRAVRAHAEHARAEPGVIAVAAGPYAPRRAAILGMGATEPVRITASASARSSDRSSTPAR